MTTTTTETTSTPALVNSNDRPALLIALGAFHAGFDVTLPSGSIVRIPVTVRGLGVLEHLLRLQALPKSPVSDKIGSPNNPLQYEIDKWLVGNTPSVLKQVKKPDQPAYITLDDLGL